MKIEKMSQLDEIKQKYSGVVSMRIESEDSIDIQVLGGDNHKYYDVGKFIKKIYSFFEKNKIYSARVMYKNLGFVENGFDVKIYLKDNRYYINESDIDSIDSQLSKIFCKSSFEQQAQSSSDTDKKTQGKEPEIAAPNDKEE